jgi:hypothetical protein
VRLPRLDDHGSIVLLTPIREAAADWLDENVATEPWQWIGPALSIERRYVGTIAEAMIADVLEPGD